MSRTFSVTVITLALSIACGACKKTVTEPAAPHQQKGPTKPAEATCELASEIPHDVAGDWDQASFDRFSWQEFSAITAAKPGGQGSPMWKDWSSTSSYLNSIDAETGSPQPFGTRHYPAPCKAVDNYESYRVVEQVSKVADSIFEASSKGLSHSPVIDANGYFIRYEILINKDQYEFMSNEKLYEAARIWSGTDQTAIVGTCGDTPGPTGVMNVKLAWMVLNPDPDNPSSSDLWPVKDYITEDILIYNSKAANSNGQASCAKMKMGLVGMHIAHKTKNQPNWIWSTFEHINNAPDCNGWKPLGKANKSCPATVNKKWNFFSEACNSGLKCQSCNTTPAPNGGSRWYADKQGLANAGDKSLSRICRMVPTANATPNSYGYGSAALNSACMKVLDGSVVGNYELISTQWFDWVTAKAKGVVPTATPGCADVADLFYSVAKNDAARNIRWYINPQVRGTTNDTTATPPILANTSMESYERSNCIGCHSKSALTNPNCADPSTCKAERWNGTLANGKPGFLPFQGQGNGKPPPDGCGTDKGTLCAMTNAYNFTDFSWWLAVEVPVDGIQP